MYDLFNAQSDMYHAQDCMLRMILAKNCVLLVEVVLPGPALYIGSGRPICKCSTASFDSISKHGFLEIECVKGEFAHSEVPTY